MSPENRKALLAELASGIQLTLANAEKLFQDGQLLRKAGSLARAYLCHQVSLEECCKIENIGVWIANLFLGDDVDITAMTLALRSHEAKNYANANFAGLITREAEVGKRDDRKRAIEAFKTLEKRFHQSAKAAKDASLYVGYCDGLFCSPGEVIGEEAVVGIATVNEYILDLADPTVRVAERMAKEDRLFGLALQGFSERVEMLKQAKAEGLPVAFGAVLDAMLQQYKKAEKK